MEKFPVSSDADLERIEQTEELAVEQIDASNAVETVGKTREDRLSDISHALEYRRELITAGFAEIKEARRAGGIDGSFASIPYERKKDFWKTEKRRKNYVERYEKLAQIEIDELLTTLNLEDPTDQAILLDKLNQEYILLKTRLVVVELETRRLLNMFYDFYASNHTSEDRYERVQARLGERSADAAEIVLLEIDMLRRKGFDDTAIYRKLSQKYHPDVSEHEKSEQIAKILNTIYNKKHKRFLI